ncbi:hypothetical protein C4559_02715 [Candidatus Microgenomates bacterium]|nr:MAG: hypothetical protein C4559_02715 [Candidatus Microgenomates bacterium]
MLKTRRTRKRNKRKIIFTVCFFGLIFFFVFIFVFKLKPNLNFGKKVFISPLALNLKPVSGDSGVKNLESILKKNNISFSSVEISTGSSYLIKTTDGGEVVLSSEKSLENQISSLQLILSRLTIEGKRFERFDFRFDKPIITLK